MQVRHILFYVTASAWFLGSAISPSSSLPQTSSQGKKVGNRSNPEETANSKQDDPSQTNSKQKDTASAPDKDSSGKEKSQNSSSDQGPIQSEVLAFRGLRRDASKIYDRIATAVPKGPTALVIYDSTQYKAISVYESSKGQFDGLIQQYCGVLKQTTVTTPTAGGHFAIAIAPVLSGIQEANKTVAGILETLKTTTEQTASGFSVTDDALAAEVANLFKSSDGTKTDKAVEVFYPALYPPALASDNNLVVPSDLDSACDLSTGRTVMQRLYALGYLRVSGDALRSAVQDRMNDLDKTVDDLGKKKPTSDVEKSLNEKEIQNAKNEKTEWLTLAQKIDALDKGMDGFIATIMKADASGNSIMSSLVSVEYLVSELKKSGTYTLQLKIQRSGGDMIKKSNLFYGTRFYYGGGSIVTFFLLDSNGAIRSSGNFFSETSYVRDKHLKNIEE